MRETQRDQQEKARIVKELLEYLGLKINSNHYEAIKKHFENQELGLLHKYSTNKAYWLNDIQQMGIDTFLPGGQAQQSAAHTDSMENISKYIEERNSGGMKTEALITELEKRTLSDQKEDDTNHSPERDQLIEKIKALNPNFIEANQAVAELQQILNLEQFKAKKRAATGD